MTNQLSASFRGTIGIASAELIRLPVSPFPFHVPITFVACYHDAYDFSLHVTHALQDIDSAQHICLESQLRVLVGPGYDKLGSQVKYKIGFMLYKRFFQKVVVPHIPIYMIDEFIDFT